MNVHRNERGSAAVEAPLAIVLVFLLTMGVTTVVQLVWTHLSLSSAVRTTTRYASHVDYDPASPSIERRRTADEVKAWAEEVAAEAGVSIDDVTVVGRHLPSNEPADIEDLVAGDEVLVTVETEVTNPLYQLAASVANVASNVVGAGDVFERDVSVHASARTYVE